MIEYFGQDTQPKLILDEKELGIFELSTDEQLAKKIYEATGDKVFKGFLPGTWQTKYITQMRDVHDRLKKEKKLTALAMAWSIPSVSQKAHQYFIENVGKIKGWLDQPKDILKPLTPVLWIAGIGVGAYLLSQVTGILKTVKKS